VCVVRRWGGLRPWPGGRGLTQARVRACVRSRDQAKTLAAAIAKGKGRCHSQPAKCSRPCVDFAPLVCGRQRLVDACISHGPLSRHAQPSTLNARPCAGPRTTLR